METVTWEDLAHRVKKTAVRIIAGSLQRNNDPLIAALSKNITTSTLWTGEGDPHPMCVVGEVNSIRGAAKIVTQSAEAGGLHPNFATNPSITVRPQEICQAHGEVHHFIERNFLEPETGPGP